MLTKIAWVLFLALVVWISIFSLKDLLPEKAKDRDEFHHLMKNGIDGVADVVSKRKAEVQSTLNPETNHTDFFVTLEFQINQRTYKKEFRYFGRQLSPREEWEKINPGDRFAIRFDTASPDNFYAPSFLEFGEKTAGPELEFWLYAILGSLLAIAVGYLFYRFVLRPSST